MTDSVTEEMTPNDPDRPKDEYIAAGKQNLRDFDLTPITERVKRRRNVEEEQAEALEGKFKKFTLMALEERGPEDDPDKEIAPSELLDEYWHEFLLDTRRYHEYCDYVFGYFMHHNPLEEEG